MTGLWRILLQGSSVQEATSEHTCHEPLRLPCAACMQVLPQEVKDALPSEVKDFLEKPRLHVEDQQPSDGYAYGSSTSTTTVMVRRERLCWVQALQGCMWLRELCRA